MMKGDVLGKECKLCGRIGTRGFVTYGSEDWRCGRDDLCRQRQAKRRAAEVESRTLVAVPTTPDVHLTPSRAPATEPTAASATLEERIQERLAAPRPIMWDGAAIVWGKWHSSNVFLCDRRSRKPRETCAQCHSTTTLSLHCRGHVFRPQWRLSLTRCFDCGADTVLDWNDEAWDLDASDYGEAGSWPEPAATALFEIDPPRTCVTCGRHGERGFTDGPPGPTCTNTDLCETRRTIRMTEHHGSDDH